MTIETARRASLEFVCVFGHDAIRLSADQSEELDTIAAVDGQPISQVIRSAITEHIEERKRDAAFQDMLRQRIERARRMLPNDKQ